MADVKPRGEISLYAAPRAVTDIHECFFYHTMDIPVYGVIEGEWDLREGIADYLGQLEFRGRRVLEIGTASGALCFHMEKCGAEVVAYDLSRDHSWDVIPYEQYDYSAFARLRQQHIDRINNAYWLCHRLFHSKAKVVYGSVYEVPEEIGPVDVVTFGSVLLHVRDPFLALQKSLRITRDTVVVTERYLPEYARISHLRNFLARVPFRTTRSLAASLRSNCLEFTPDFVSQEPKETWWHLSPDIIVRMIGVLGFGRARVSLHTQKYNKSSVTLFTVVGHRTHGRAIPACPAEGSQAGSVGDSGEASE